MGQDRVGGGGVQAGVDIAYITGTICAMVLRPLRPTPVVCPQDATGDVCVLTKIGRNSHDEE